MKKYVLSVALIATCFLTKAQVTMPAPSSTQTITQDFGMGKIVLTYSRPNLKERSYFQDKSDLAPFGEMWRTGANAATRLRFTDFVTMGGKDLDSGSYVLYTIPGADKWTIIINKGLDNWGTDGYKESDDVVRFTVPSHNLNTQAVESLTMQIGNIKPESCELYLMWGKTVVVIPITTNIKDRLRAQIEKALKNDAKPNYWQAANFYYEWDKDYPKALANVNKAIDGNADGFWMYLLKAKIHKEMGDMGKAKASAEKCKEVATKAKNDDYVKQADKFLQSL